jgi:hypothetical protein
MMIGRMGIPLYASSLGRIAVEGYRGFPLG